VLHMTLPVTASGTGKFYSDVYMRSYQLLLSFTCAFNVVFTSVVFSSHFSAPIAIIIFFLHTLTTLPISRIETFPLFAVDPNPNRFEKYAGSIATVESSVGSFSNLQDGIVRFEIWQAVGPAGDDPMRIRTDAAFSTEPWREDSPLDFSFFTIPFANTSRSVSDACEPVAEPCDGAYDRCLVCNGAGDTCVSPPLISPTDSEQLSSFTVTVTPSDDQDAGASFRYTLDGTTPTETSTLYTSPIDIPYVADTQVTFSARGFIDGHESSAVVTASYAMPSATSCSQIIVQKGCNLQCLNTLTAVDEEFVTISHDATGNEYSLAPPTDRSHVKTYLIDHLYGVYDETKAITRFSLWVDAGTTAGRAIEARISYDFENDGTFDRVETFKYKALDAVDGLFEKYASDVAGYFLITGDSYRNMTDGLIQLELWQPIGTSAADVIVRVGESSPIFLPYTSMSRDAEPIATSCNLACSGGIALDACGVCGGDGPSGCDNTCFSVKQLDSCGVCDGMGPTGCDKACFSDNVVDSCGVCGGPGGCLSGGPTCTTLKFTSAPSLDLICSYATSDIGQTTINVPDLASNPGLNIPANARLVFTRGELYGFYDNLKQASLTLYADSGVQTGVGVRTALSYDFDGDGSADRIAYFQPCNLDPVSGYEQCLWKDTDGYHVGKLPAPFQTFTNGSVTVYAWSAYGNANPGTLSVVIGKDEGESKASSLTLPYTDSTYWGGDDSVPTATCSDSILNGDEEGVDCGGSLCAPCPSYHWVASEWNSTCEAVGECGVELDPLSRLITCESTIDQLVVNNAFCQHLTKPAFLYECPFTPCFSWNTLEWSPPTCPSCGDDQTERTRVVYCVSSSGSTVPVVNCANMAKPVEQEACPTVNPCREYTWHVGEWAPPSCPLCGTEVVTRTRTVSCRTEGGEIVDDGNCAAPDRPVFSQLCGSIQPCENLDWVVSDWSPACPPCGLGGDTQSREVLCVDAADGVVVLDSYCIAAAGTRPIDTQPCSNGTSVDSCGVCGGGSDACGTPFPDCGRLWATNNVLDVPSFQYNLSCDSASIGGVSDAFLEVPSSAGTDPLFSEPSSDRTLELRIHSLYGFVVPFGKSEIRLVLDALHVAGMRTRAKLEYDFNGDGIADRVEVYEVSPTNDVPNYEVFNLEVNDLIQGESVLASFETMRGGSVRLVLWASTPLTGSVRVLLGANPSVEGAEDYATSIRIPYISSYWGFADGVATPRCDDGILNGDEDGVDCGGPCASCQNLDWSPGAWSMECSDGCLVGSKERTRSVACINTDTQEQVSEQLCNPETRPVESEICENPSCYLWVPGAWNKTCPSCGASGRVRSRTVTCVGTDLSFRSEDQCDTFTRPSSSMVCDFVVCRGSYWETSEWAPAACPSCGSGVTELLRDVHCRNDSHSPIPDSNCDSLTKPTPIQVCGAVGSCPSNRAWQTVKEWSSCPRCVKPEDTFGKLKEYFATRTVSCFDTDADVVVADSECDFSTKPSTIQLCPDTLVIDNCGVCGGKGGCPSPSESLLACSKLVFSIDPSHSLKCLVSEIEPLSSFSIPSSDFEHTLVNPPPDAVSFYISNLDGYYMEGFNTSISLQLDALRAVGLRTRVRILYDFEGDKEWDRIEVYRVLSTDPLPGFESFSIASTEDDIAATAEFGQTDMGLAPFRNLTGGAVLVQIWSASFASGPIYLRTDGGGNAGDVPSFLEIPFVSAHVNTTGSVDTASEYGWFVGSWVESECSASCLASSDATRTRHVACVSRDSQEIVDDSICASFSTKPAVEGNCPSLACRWRYSDWSPPVCPECSSTVVVRQREPQCIDTDDVPIPGERCENVPVDQLSDTCPTVGICSTWVTTDWAPLCPKCYAVGAATVTQHRNVSCVSPQGMEVQNSECEKDISVSKPAASSVCMLENCPTCKDGKRNGEEVGVDCGGICGNTCPVVVVQVRFFVARNDSTSTDPYPTASDVVTALCNATEGVLHCRQLFVTRSEEVQVSDTAYLEVVVQVFTATSLKDGSQPSTIPNGDAAGDYLVSLLLDPPSSLLISLGGSVVTSGTLAASTLSRSESSSLCVDSNGIYRDKCPSDSSSVISGGLGIVVAAVIAVLVILAVLCIFHRRRQGKQRTSREGSVGELRGDASQEALVHRRRSSALRYAARGGGIISATSTSAHGSGLDNDVSGSTAPPTISPAVTQDLTGVFGNSDSALGSVPGNPESSSSIQLVPVATSPGNRSNTPSRKGKGVKGKKKPSTPRSRKPQRK